MSLNPSIIVKMEGWFITCNVHQMGFILCWMLPLQVVVGVLKARLLMSVVLINGNLTT